MIDRVLQSFLIRQRDEGLALARSSDRLDLVPLDGPATQRYVATFHCNGIVRTAAGRIAVAGRFDVGIWFPSDYLRRADAFEVLTWLAPRSIWHPNVHDRAPRICIGRLTPGTHLVDILYQCYEVITYHKVTMTERDALNHQACAWARRNRHRFPIDTRPLKRPEAQRRGDLPAGRSGS